MRVHVLHEAFHRSDGSQFASVDDVAAVGVGAQNEPEGPRSPEHVDVAVGETGVVEFDET